MPNDVFKPGEQMTMMHFSASDTGMLRKQEFVPTATLVCAGSTGINQ